MNLEKATKLARQQMKEKLRETKEASGYNLEQLEKYISNLQDDNYVPNKNKEGRNG